MKKQQAHKKHLPKMYVLTVIEEMGNPFEEDSHDLLVLNTKEIADSRVIETVHTAKQIGKTLFEEFSKDSLIDISKPIKEPIPKNKLPLFNTSRELKAAKAKQQMMSLKNDAELFAQLYIGCQMRDGNVDGFFRHEN